jgi:hypothetical protein
MQRARPRCTVRRVPCGTRARHSPCSSSHISLLFTVTLSFLIFASAMFSLQAMQRRPLARFLVCLLVRLFACLLLIIYLLKMPLPLPLQCSAVQCSAGPPDSYVGLAGWLVVPSMRPVGPSLCRRSRSWETSSRSSAPTCSASRRRTRCPRSMGKHPSAQTHMRATNAQTHTPTTDPPATEANGHAELLVAGACRRVPAPAMRRPS